MHKNNFKQKVLGFIKSIPKGKVVSYGFVANFCGKPRGAREVGYILRQVDVLREEIPWWRVVNSKGEISIKGNIQAGKETQAMLLKKDGVAISKEYKIDIKRYGYKGFKSK